ncbi:cupin domain-containing protein [Qipengyuania qiaonensis]|uniref:Cupin domain-containing protein n=1 Tax=Qipengyuania qiaonensis TaxID=2867240 RepID=A0ABS7JAB6_9SPHN|nr:cupin domain-containing protein [Qipengyuania qiaonensis]
MSEPKVIIERLGLEPHPEGGWYRETWRAPSAEGERASATAILFLLEQGQHSHWHRIDATEIWLWHAGDPLELSLAAGDAGPVEHVALGPEVIAGQSAQHVIPPYWWQAARPCDGEAGYTLLSCVVSPGFEFSGFELARPDWHPGK